MSDFGTREEPSTLEQLTTPELLSTLRDESVELISALDSVILGKGRDIHLEDLQTLERLKALVEEITSRPK